jgi:hypothetical protein
VTLTFVDATVKSHRLGLQLRKFCLDKRFHGAFETTVEPDLGVATVRLVTVPSPTKRVERARTRLQRIPGISQKCSKKKSFDLLFPSRNPPQCPKIEKKKQNQGRVLPSKSQDDHRKRETRVV